MNKPSNPVRPDWKLIEFRSIYENDVQKGYLTPSGVVMDFVVDQHCFPPHRHRLADKNEVKEIVRYLTD